MAPPIPGLLLWPPNRLHPERASLQHLPLGLGGHSDSSIDRHDHLLGARVAP